MRLADCLRSGAALLSLALLAACARPEAARPAPAGTAAAVACRVGPDGGPPRAERGIGGTGAPAQAVQQAERGLGGTGLHPGTTLEGDRGIGGTGAPPQAVLQADRGIGGTGIVAVITGFASVCLGGREVALEAGVPILMDDRAATPSALRAGQLAIVEAAGDPATLKAVTLRVRHEVVGPVEALEAGGLLRVAGQPVAITLTTLGERAPKLGQWVAVSGLRRPDHVVLATRIDPWAPGPVTVHGLLQRAGGTFRIGTLEVRPAGPVPSGQYVTASGRYADGVLQAAAITPDLLLIDPAGYFGPGIGLFLFEAFVTEAGEQLRLGPGLRVTAWSGRRPGVWGRAVLELERSNGGPLRATGLRQGGSALGGPGGGRLGPDFATPMGPGGGPGRLGGPSGPTAAPMPNRTLGADDASKGAMGGARRGRFDDAGAPGSGPGGAGPFSPDGIAGGLDARPGGRGR